MLMLFVLKQHKFLIFYLKIDHFIIKSLNQSDSTFQPPSKLLPRNLKPGISSKNIPLSTK
jgi:hypothetical protein